MILLIISLRNNMEYFWFMFGAFLLFMHVTNGQVYLFQTIDEHNQRLTAVESTIANMTMCCNDVRKENEWLKQVTVNLTSMLARLTKEVELLKLQSKSGASSMTMTQRGSTQSKQAGTTTLLMTPTSTLLQKSTSASSNQPKTSPKSTVQQKSTTSAVSSRPQTTPTSTSSIPKLTQTSAIQPNSNQSKTTQVTPTRTVTASTTKQATQIEGSDCADLFKKGVHKSGVYKIRTSKSKSPVPAYCDMENDGGGWTVIQRRRDGSVNFDRDWASYRDGFGNVSGEFWLGNDHIHDLTSSGNARLRIQVTDWTRVTGYAEYQYFNVQSEGSNYRLSVGSYKGTIGDSFNYPNSYLLRHNQMAFSTKDRDHDKSFNNCARILKGGWWFNSCYSSNLNGQFSKIGPYGTHTMGEIAGEPTLEGTGVEWYPWKHKQYSMLQSEMKIRPDVFP